MQPFGYVAFSSYQAYRPLVVRTLGAVGHRRPDIFALAHQFGSACQLEGEIGPFFQNFGPTGCSGDSLCPLVPAVQKSQYGSHTCVAFDPQVRDGLFEGKHLLGQAFRLPFFVRTEHIGGVVPQQVRGDTDRSFHRLGHHKPLRARLLSIAFPRILDLNKTTPLVQHDKKRNFLFLESQLR